MTLEEYDRRRDVARILRTEVSAMLQVVHKYESDIERESGVEYVSREPGFPCWLWDDKYYNTLRDAIEAREKGEVTP